MDGDKVHSTFQQHKRGKEIGEEDSYTKHGTYGRNKGEVITFIHSSPIYMVVRILACCVMQKQNKGDCNLYILTVDEVCTKGKFLK